jgi:DNA-binding NarL/FixJ family response regulator
VSRPKVLLADDYEPIVRSLVRFLRNDFEIVATVGDGQALVDAARRLRPDVIVADISMPLMSGPEALGELRTEGLGVPVIFLTAHPDAGLAAAVIQAGAAGIVLKHSSGDELVTAIREALQGRAYVSPLISE